MNKNNLQQELLEKIVNIIDRDFESKKESLSLSLFNGLGGLVLFYYYYSRNTGKEKYRIKANMVLEMMIHQLNSNTFHALQNYYCFSTGLAGVAYTFWHIEKCGFAYCDFESNFLGVNDFFVGEAKKDFDKGISDFLHGPLGILYYIICQYSGKDQDNMIKELFISYIDSSIVDKRGIRIRNMILEDVDIREYDLGLAHGLSGHLLVFLKLYEKCNSPKVLQIIRLGIRYIISSKKGHSETNENSLFPTSIIESPERLHQNLNNYKSRLAWCYGDLNIAWLLIKVGKITKSFEVLNYGIEIGLTTIGRKESLRENLVGDIFVCHGSSGVAYIYKRFYEETNVQKFYDAYLYWINYTTDKFSDTNWDSIKNSKVFSVLDGLLGVAFTLLPAYRENEMSWDDILLMN
jgi:lantibiotic modifying enzyme